MIKRHSNGWIDKSEFPRIIQRVFNDAQKGKQSWLGHINCKYLSFYMDQRTGDFLIKGYDGTSISDDELFQMFPDLKD